MSNGPQAQNKNEKPIKPLKNAVIGNTKEAYGQPTNSKSNRDGDASSKLSYKYNAPSIKKTTPLTKYGKNTSAKGTSGSTFKGFIS